MVYKYKEAARIKCDAQVAGELCEKLEKNGGLTAARLVDESRPADAPLHGEFEWDDTKAAEKYREDQARYIIRSLVVQVEEPEPVSVRAFHAVSERRHFESISVILADPKKTNALMDMAMKELQAFVSKYDTLKELSPVFDAIEQIKSRNAR